MTTNQPYTYLIGWSILDKWYYGTRYSKSCHPDDLWNPYKTSSHIVKEFAKEFGEPDIVQVRKLHDSAKKALAWEEKVLRRLKAVKSDRWINANNGGREFNNINGRPRDEKCRQRIRNARKLWWDGLSDEEKQPYIESARAAGVKGAKKISDKAKARFSNETWFNDVHMAARMKPEYRKRLSHLQLERQNDPAYVAKHLASVNTPEYKAKMSEISKRNGARPEVKKKKSESLKQTLSTPEARLKKSEAAKASTAKRLASRERNKLLQSK